MAFSLTYHTILNGNIRHVYFGHPLNLHYRKSSEYPNMDQLRKQREDQLLKNYILRIAEYEPRYKCLIPRAPAFRVFSRHTVDDIVCRLHQPPPTSASRSREERGSRKRESSEDRKVSLRVMTREEKDKSLKRIQKDTAMSMMRERPPHRLVNMGLNAEN